MADETARGRTEASELNRLGQTAARRAAEAAATVPVFRASVRTPPSGFSLRAVASALRAVPAVNGAYRDGRAERYSRVNLGLALPGPVVVTLFDADARDEAALRSEHRALLARDPESFSAAELAGATFTIVGLGLELDALEPLVVPRQAACLGVGRTALTLACDARLLTPADAAAFLGTLAPPSGA